MELSNLPLWYKEISYHKKNNIISYGLTIPYLIGSYQVCQISSSDSPIYSLFYEIIESDLEKCAVLQLCTNINQYVIGIEDIHFCEKFLKKEIKFKNSNGKIRLYITQNACELGNNRELMIKKIENLYIDQITNLNFSWNNQNMIWEKFNKDEIEIIEKGKNFE